MPLDLKFSNSLTTLSDILADLERSGSSPFEKEYIIIASTGLRRWLSQGIADRRGIHANCEFPTPRTFINLLLEKVLGTKESPQFAKDAMTWRIYDILSKGDGTRELELPITYIRKNRENRDLATLQLAVKVADLFDQYLTYRPDWILSWETRRNIRTNQGDGARLKKQETWQACLWRMLADGDGVHRARLYEEVLKALKRGAVAGLPEQLSVFGTHTLPPVFLRILKAVANHHSVTIYLTQPTPEFWGDHPLRSIGSRSRRLLTETCRDGMNEYWGNPLVAALGGQGRDLFNVLIDEDIATTEEDDMNLFQAPANDTILGAVQRSVYELAETVEQITDEPALDDSLRFHCCHHPLREVEVLHDTLLRWFKENPELTPSDVLVLAPDIERYSPFIETVFGQPETGIPDIPFSISDRSFRLNSRIVDGFFKILAICQSRFAATDMFALFQSPVFRNRFGWTEDELSKVRKWLSDNGTAWGIDEHHRALYDIPAFNEYSWEATMEKILLGYALPRQRDSTDPGFQIYDQVEGQDSILIGKLMEAIMLLKDAASAVATPRTPSSWATVIESKVVKAFLDSNPEESLEVRQIRQGLDKLGKCAENLSTPIEFGAMVAFLETLIEDSITARGFLSKGVAFGSLQPMRAIPRRIVCILGMDTGAFPRDPRPLGFNLMRHKGMSRPGDRANNQSGRYLFLETILSAGDKLHFSFSGFSPRDDSFSPPATPAGELIDFLHKTWPASEQNLLKSPFLLSHRLHGHHADYFDQSVIGLHSFSRSKYRAASVSLQPKHFDIHGKLDKADIPEIITLDELTAFFINPAKYFFNRQLGVELPYSDKDLPQSEPLELDNLARYKIRETRIFGKIGWPTRPLSLHSPPGEYGKWCMEKITEEADALYENLDSQAGFKNRGNPDAVKVELPIMLADRTYLISGEIDKIYDNTRILFRPAEVKPKDLIPSWIAHLLLNISDRKIQTEIFSGKQSIKKSVFAEIEADAALEILTQLLSAYLSGQTSPLPWVLECSSAYAESKFKGGNDDWAMTETMKAWLPNSYSSSFPPSANPWNVLCWGNRPPFLAPYTNCFTDVAVRLINPMMEYLQ